MQKITLILLLLIVCCLLVVPSVADSLESFEGNNTTNVATTVATTYIPTNVSTTPTVPQATGSYVRPVLAGSDAFVYETITVTDSGFGDMLYKMSGDATPVALNMIQGASQTFHLLDAAVDPYLGVYYNTSDVLENPNAKTINIWYPSMILKGYLAGTSDIIDGKTILRGTALEFIVEAPKVGPVADLTVPASLQTGAKIYFTTPVGGKTTRLNASEPYFDAMNFAKNVEVSDITIVPQDACAGTYVAQAEFTNANNVFPGIPDKYKRSNVISFTIQSDYLTLTANKDSVVLSNPFTVVVQGAAKTNYEVFIEGFDASDLPPYVLPGQNGVDISAASHIEGYMLDGIQYNSSAKINTDASGKRTVQYNTFSGTEDKTYTFRVEKTADSTYYDKVKVKVEKGAVTITASGDRSYAIGEEVKLTGTNTDSSEVFLFITGPNLKHQDGIILKRFATQAPAYDATSSDIVSVKTDNTWEYNWDTADLPLETGTYTIYATSVLTNGKSSAPTFNETTGTSIAVKLSDSEYATLALNFNHEPTIRTVHAGDDVFLSEEIVFADIDLMEGDCLVQFADDTGQVMTNLFSSTILSDGLRGFSLSSDQIGWSHGTYYLNTFGDPHYVQIWDPKLTLQGHIASTGATLHKASILTDTDLQFVLKSPGAGPTGLAEVELIFTTPGGGKSTSFGGTDFSRIALNAAETDAGSLVSAGDDAVPGWYSVQAFYLDNGIFSFADWYKRSDTLWFRVSSGEISVSTSVITVYAPSNTVAKNDRLVFSGNVSMDTDSLILYVFGPNKYYRQKIPVGNREFYHELEISSDWSSNQYYVILEHPGEDGEFGVVEEKDSGNYQTLLKTSRDSLIVEGSNKLQGSNAADALCRMIDFPNSDDYYTKFTFTVQEPWIKIDNPGDRTAGSVFTITGTTNLAIDDQILIEVVSSSFNAIDKTSTSTTSGFSQTTKVVEGKGSDNAWFIDVDTTDFKLDEYTIKACGIEADVTTTRNFNLVEGTPVTDIISPGTGSESWVSISAMLNYSMPDFAKRLVLFGTATGDTVYLGVVDHIPGMAAVPVTEYVVPARNGLWNLTVDLVEPVFVEGKYYTIYASSTSLAGGVTGKEKTRISISLEPAETEKFLTITAVRDRSYYIGDTITFSGWSKGSDEVFLFITGPNLPNDGASLSAIAEINWNGLRTQAKDGVPAVSGVNGYWEYAWDTHQCGLDTGAYTIYATQLLTNGKSSVATIVDGPYGIPTTLENCTQYKLPESYADSDKFIAVRLSDSEYATVSVNLKQPFLSAVPSETHVARGDKLYIRGNAEGDPGTLQMYVFGPNYFLTESIPVEDDGSYEKELEISSSMQSSQYFVVIEHPMYNELFDVVHAYYSSWFRQYSVTPPSGGYDSSLLFVPRYNYPGVEINDSNVNDAVMSAQASFIVEGSNRLQGSNAADALTKMIDNSNIDDIYTKLNFAVESPVVWVNYLGDQVSSKAFTASGSTNLAPGRQIRVEIMPEENYHSGLTPPSGSYLSRVVTVHKGGGEVWYYENSWSVEVNLSGFALGKYVVLASDIGGQTGNIAWFELIDDVEPPIGPTVPPTVKPTTVKPTIVPPIDTVSSLSLSPGWNFISVPKQLDAHNSSAAVLFGAVDTDNHAILSYDTVASDWNTLDGSNIVRPLEGIWIYSNSTAEIPLTYASGPMVPAVKRVYPGWNAVGLSAGGNTLAANALAGTSWRTLIPWNLQNSTWGDAIVNGGTGVNSAYQYMTVGNGYWLYVSDAGVLTGLTG